ncbi:MAG: hypothetical protein QOG87_3789 [Actinomycetota bacterium]
MHDNSILLFERYALPLFRVGSRVLEIAPDDDPSTYRKLVSAELEWSTADLATELDDTGNRRWGGGRADDLTLVMTDPYEIPAPDGSYDLIVSGQVIEHVREPWRWMGELARVCRPGGRVITVNPVSWPYHEAPVDCWRIFPEGMRALSESAGLIVESSICDSLERRPRRWYPGESHDHYVGQKGRVVNRVKAALGWPLPVAFDTITIGRKPEPEGQSESS